MRAHRKERITTAGKENVVLIDASHDHPAIWKIREWYTRRKIAY
jgi:hypothetical protein